MRTWTLIALTFVAVATSVSARPQYSLLSGNRCSGCHVNVNGAGLRSDLGWYARNDIGMISRESPALDWLYGADDGNTFLDNTLTVGMDIRVQHVRSFSDTTGDRSTFPMQFALYGAYQPIKAVTIEGQFNGASVSSKAAKYAGQRDGLYSVILQPDHSWPQLRVGLIRPSVGVRYDDHSSFPFSYVTSTRREQFIAPFWGEYGAEVSYEAPLWLTAQAGVFGTSGMQRLQVDNGAGARSSLITGDQPTITARVQFWPRFFEDMLNTYVGASVLHNNDLNMIDVFGGVGLTDEVTLMLHWMTFDKQNYLRTSNVFAEVDWQIWDPVILYVRGEMARTTKDGLVTTTSDNAFEITSAVIGATLIPIDYVEIRPEYRVWDTSLPDVTTRWFVQLHLYY